MTEIMHVQEPKGYQEAIECAYHAQWALAMKAEMNALKKNSAWTLVQPPPHVNIIGSKWVYKIKLREDGNIEALRQGW